MKIKLQISLIILLLIALISCNENGEKQEPEENPKEENAKSDNHPSILEVSEYIKKTPNDPKLYYMRSNMRLQLGNTAGAKEDIKKALELDSTQINFYLGLADIYFEEKDLIRALATLEDAHQLDKYNEKVLLQMAIYKIYMTNYKEAIEHLDEILKTNIYHAEAYFYKGILFKEIEKEDRAISSFQTALEQDPEYYEAHVELALLFAKRDDVNTALQYYDNALRLKPESIEALYGKGLLLQNAGDYQAAIDLYKNIVRKAPQNPDAYYNIGYVYFQMDSLEKADRHFKIVFNVDPSYTNAVYMRGLIQEAIGNLNKAEEFYKQSLSLQSDHEASLKGLERIESK